jgi:hypothetical protein
MSERPGPKKLTAFQWWVCFWLAMLVVAVTGVHPRVNVYIDGKQVETRK